MDRPNLDSLDAQAPELSGLRHDELRLFPAQDGYSVFLGFGAETEEYRVTAEGAFERLERSGPALAYRRYELAELPKAAHQAVLALVADYRARRAEGPEL